jgi:hypothetical protein
MTLNRVRDPEKDGINSIELLQSLLLSPKDSGYQELMPDEEHKLR